MINLLSKKNWLKIVNNSTKKPFQIWLIVKSLRKIKLVEKVHLWTEAGETIKQTFLRTRPWLERKSFFMVDTLSRTSEIVGKEILNPNKRNVNIWHFNLQKWKVFRMRKIKWYWLKLKWKPFIIINFGNFLSWQEVCFIVLHNYSLMSNMHSLDVWSPQASLLSSAHLSTIT